MTGVAESKAGGTDSGVQVIGVRDHEALGAAISPAIRSNDGPERGGVHACIDASPDK